MGSDIKKLIGFMSDEHDSSETATDWATTAINELRDHTGISSLAIPETNLKRIGTGKFSAVSDNDDRYLVLKNEQIAELFAIGHLTLKLQKDAKVLAFLKQHPNFSIKDVAERHVRANGWVRSITGLNASAILLPSGATATKTK